MAGLMDWLKANSDQLGALSVGLLSGKTGAEQFSSGIAGLQGVQKQNKTIQYLKSVNPELAQAVESGAIDPAGAYSIYAKQRFEAEKPKNNFMAVGKNLYDTQSGQWVSPPAGAAAGEDDEWGLNPVWGKDEQGQTRLGQLSKSGKFKPLDTGGFTPTPGISNSDLGTSIVTRNSRTGEVITQTPKDVAGAADQGASGKIQAEARAALPGIETAASQMLGAIDSLDNDPYLPDMLGPMDSRTPNLTSSAARVQSKMDQLGGQQFLQAFNSLRGGGQITEIEGEKATNAMARLNTAQTPEDYRAALTELRSVVNTAVQNARARAAGGGQPSASTAPGVGRTKSGIQFTVEP